MKNKIKHVILDIDGVVLGSKLEYNFPFPSKKVTEAINRISDSGVKVSLCTGKPSFAVRILMDHFPLNNFHISDGGAVIFNPYTNTYLLKKVLDNEIVKDILNIPLNFSESWQVYTLDSKYVEKFKFNPKTIEDKRIMPWIEVDKVIDTVEGMEITKMELIYPPEAEDFLKKTLSKFEDKITLQWTHTPLLLPNRILIITAKNIDKLSSVQAMLHNENCSLENVLAVGDTLMDWKFMDGAGFVATLENANDEMKNLVRKNGGFVGKHVQEDGLVDIFEFFEL
jgi:hydroxymethylpyrimidine pyrophosphatase-like HAD family hydrolase